MPTQGQRNHILAGAFTIVCLVGLLVTAIIFSGASEALRPSRSYDVRFPVELGTQGLAEGADVLLGGQKVGNVSSIGFEIDSEGRPSAVIAKARVRSSVTIASDARFELLRPLLGAGAAINIASVGVGPDLGDGDSVNGSIAPPGFLADAGFGDQQREQLRRIFASADEAASNVSELTAALNIEIPPGVRELRKFLERSSLWADRIDTILASVESTAGNVDGGVIEARDALVALRGIVTDNRQAISELVASLNRSVYTFEETSVPEVQKTIEAARRAIESTERATAEAESIVKGNRPSIDRAIANVRLATDQLKLLAIEVRRTPWRALQRPTTKELREQLVYDAAQAYLLASVELAATSDALAAAAEADARDTAELRERLRRAVEGYESSADELLRQLDAEDE